MTFRKNLFQYVFTLMLIFMTTSLAFGQIFNFNGTIRATNTGSFGNYTEITHNGANSILNASGTGDMTFLKNGALRMRLRATGRLETFGSVTAFNSPTNFSNYLQIGHGGANGYINSFGNGRMDFRHDGINKMSLTDAARLGINTTAPIAQLDVRGDNIFLAPAGSATVSPKFVGLGESGGGPFGTPCNLYGFRAQRGSGNSVNLGMQDNNAPVLLWENTQRSLELRAGGGNTACGTLVAKFTGGPQVSSAVLPGMSVNGNILASARLGVGTLNPVAQVDIRGDNLIISPNSADVDDPSQGSFAALGQSGGGPGNVLCNLYGFRSQLDPTNSINVGMRSNKEPTVQWGNLAYNLQFRGGTGSFSCGTVFASLGRTAVGNKPGLVVNGYGYIDQSLGIGTKEPIAKLDVRGNNMIVSPGGNPAAKFAALGESQGSPGGACDLYGYRAQLDLVNSINVGMQATKEPTILWGNTGINLEFRNGTGQTDCGDLIVSIGNSAANGSRGIEVNGDISTDGLWQNEEQGLERNGGTEIERALDKVLALNGVKHENNYALDFDNLERVMPDLVVEKAEGVRSMNLGAMMPVVVEAFKDQQELIDTQYDIIEEQRTEMDAMEIRMQRLEALVNNLSGDSKAQVLPVDKGVRLAANRPNPFDQVTTIDYVLPETMSNAKLVVFGMTGQPVANYDLKASSGNVTFDASDLGTGTYIYAIFADGEILAQKKMILQR